MANVPESVRGACDAGAVVRARLRPRVRGFVSRRVSLAFALYPSVEPGDLVAREIPSPSVRRSSIGIAVTLFTAATLAGADAHADPPTPPPSRSDGWNQATNILAFTSVATQVLMPRVFFSDPEVTAGWKARWHVSVLAPAMTLTALAFFNEVQLKNSIGGAQPGCGTARTREGRAARPTASCPRSPSSPARLSDRASASFWSTPSSGATAKSTRAPSSAKSGYRSSWRPSPPSVGRRATGKTAGNLGEAQPSGSLQGWGLGLLYASLQRPECGYTGNLICW